MRHKAGVLAVAFSPDGKRLLTGSADNTASRWDCSVPNYPEEPETVELFVEIMTGLALSPDPDSQSTPLTDDELTTRWQRLERNAGPFLEQLRQRSIRRGMEGHRHAAREAEDVANWFAAEFHLRHLFQAEPENQDFKMRHKRAKRELEHSKAGANSPQAFPPPKPVVAEKPE